MNICRLAAQRYLFAYQEPMPVEQLVRYVCDTKQVRRGKGVGGCGGCLAWRRGVQTLGRLRQRL